MKNQNKTSQGILKSLQNRFSLTLPKICENIGGEVTKDMLPSEAFEIETKVESMSYVEFR